MQTWVKHPEHTFGAPDGYESGDWRDPFVFRDEHRRPVADAPGRPALRRTRTPPRRHRPVRLRRPRDVGARRAVLGSAPLHHPRVPRGLRSGATGGTSSTPSSPNRSPPATAWPSSPDGPWTRAGARHARRPRLLRREVRRARRAALLLRLDRQPRKATPTTAPGSGPAPCPCWRPGSAPTARWDSASPDELVDSFWDDVPGIA